MSEIRILLCIIMISLPFFVGCVFRSRSIICTYLFGQLLMWALFQISAVPQVFFRVPFTTLFWSYTILVTVFAVLGMISYRTMKFRKPEISMFHVFALLPIAYQCGLYLIGMHYNDDDARWIAEANDALVKNKMLLYHPATGEYIGRFAGEMVKDVFSPWSMYLAWMSYASGIKAVIIAHTIYAPVLLALCYCVYSEIGAELFKGKNERGIFLLMVSVINMYMAGNGYTQAAFSLVRIWQGKAVVAAIMIPTMILCSLRILGKQEEEEENGYTTGNGMLLIIAGASCCLFSGMGIAIGLLVIGVYGLYMVFYGLTKKAASWKSIIYWFLSMTPSMVYGLAYMWLKG